MKRTVSTYLLGFLLAFWGYSQEEEQSAAVFLEEYTDEFQENFFEALKQKGIQNYDRAIDLFLQCKSMDLQNSVIDYELAKAYFLDKQYVHAQEYAIAALDVEPNDYWYLESLVNILEKQGSAIRIVEDQIPYNEKKLQENLAVIYFKKEKYQSALKVLGNLENSQFVSDLTERINDSLKPRPSRIVSKTVKKASITENPVEAYKIRIEALLEASKYHEVETISKEALDSYPLQPYFYFAYGKSLNQTSRSAKAVEVLESALDYLLDDDTLANKIYNELSKSYMTIGNTIKAKEYQQKVKPGL